MVKKNKLNTDFSDTVLLDKLKSGDEIVFTQLIQQFHDVCVRLVRSIVGEANAEEVVQESWISVYRNLATFENRSHIKTWIFRICINTAKSRIRYNVSRRIDQEVTESSSGDFADDGHWVSPVKAWHNETPEAILQSEQLCHVLHNGINDLPELQQSIIIMHDIEGVELEEICNILDISSSNSRVLLHRARSKLRQLICEFQAGTHD